MIGNQNLRLNSNWNIFTTFTNPLSIQIKGSFDLLPKKLLETFRIINFTTPPYVFILRGILLMMGMDNNSSVFAKKIILFFDLVSNNICNKVFLLKDKIEKQDFKRNQFSSCLKRIDFAQILRIVKKSNENLIKSGKNIESVAIETEIIAEIKKFLKTIVSSNHWQEVLEILDLVFGRRSAGNKGKKREETQKFNEFLNKFESSYGLVHSKRFSKCCKNLYEILENGNMVFICGKVGVSKSTIIKSTAFIQSSLKGILIFLKKK